MIIRRWLDSRRQKEVKNSKMADNIINRIEQLKLFDEIYAKIGNNIYLSATKTLAGIYPVLIMKGNYIPFALDSPGSQYIYAKIKTSAKLKSFLVRHMDCFEMSEREYEAVYRGWAKRVTS